MFNDLRIDRDKYLIVLNDFHEFVKLFKIQKQNLFDIDNIFDEIRDKFKTIERKKKRIMNQLIDKRIEYNNLMKMNKNFRFERESKRDFERVFNVDNDENQDNIDENSQEFVDDDFVVTNFVKSSKKKRTNKHSNLDKFTNNVNFD